MASCLGLLPSTFVARSLQIHADKLVARASLAAKIPAASCHLYSLPPPYRAGLLAVEDSLRPLMVLSSQRPPLNSSVTAPSERV